MLWLGCEPMSNILKAKWTVIQIMYDRIGVKPSDVVSSAVWFLA